MEIYYTYYEERRSGKTDAGQSGPRDQGRHLFV